MLLEPATECAKSFTTFTVSVSEEFILCYAAASTKSKLYNLDNLHLVV